MVRKTNKSKIESSLKPSEKRHQRTQQAILDAARQIIHEEGSNALSMRAIAQRIDYSPAGLYEYFGSKEEIIGEICQQGHHRLKSYMERVSTALPIEAYLRETGLAYIEFAVQNPDFFLLMFTTIPTLPPADEMTGEALQQTLEEELMGENSAFVVLIKGIQRGVDEGVFTTQPSFGVMEMALGAWSMVHGLAMLRVTFLQGFQADFGLVERETLRAFYQGLIVNQR